MAQNHVGEKATVCGNVVSSHYARSSKGRPTFLDLDVSYPNPVFTAIIWGDDRRKFGRTEVKYSEKNICVTGKIKQYHGVAEMVLYSPRQIRVK